MISFVFSYYASFELRNDFGNLKQFESLTKSLSLELQASELEAVSKNPSSYQDIQKYALSFLENNLKFENNVINYAAQKLADGNVVAWFQGAMEAGPRALGNRSILADTRDVRNRIVLMRK